MNQKIPNKLKIAIMVDQLVPGGVQKSAIEEAKNLKNLGHQVTLFVLVKLHYEYQYQDLSLGLDVVFLSDFNPWPFKKAIKIPYFAFLTNLHILNPFFAGRYKVLKNFDFMISHGTTTCITAAAISRKLHIPYLAFIWDPMTFILEKVYSKTPARYLFPLIKPLTRYYERSFLTSAALVATSSRVHQKFINENYNLTPKIIYPGCIPPKKIPKKTGRSILGYSRWELAKNPELFLWLSQKIQGIKIILAGAWNNPQEEEYFKRLIKRRGLDKKIFLTSPVGKRDLKKLARKSTVWVHPNFEAFGMSGLESASYGLPIVIPRGSGLTEIFEEGKHGFFPSEKDKESFLKYVNMLLENPEMAYKIGHSAASRASKFTWKRHSKIVLNTIQKYISQTKMVFLANAFVATHSIGGGDRFLIELASRAPKNFHITIITPSVGYYHWLKDAEPKDNIRIMLLQPTIFDNKDEPISLFLAYATRAIQTTILLPRLPHFKAIYTATDIFTDALPAYLYRRGNDKVTWISRFFHFIPTPLKREGRLWVNVGSYLLQQFSLKLLPYADLSMIDNQNLLSKLVKKGINKKQIKYHPGGVDIEKISKAIPKKEYKSDAIFLGRLQHHKGALDSVDVWSKVVNKKPNAKLLMVGYIPPRDKEKLIEKINDLHLTKNIKLAGYIIERDEVYRYLRSSKFLLFLDHEAGFGLVVTEAMAVGLPTVAYNLPIFGSIYKNGFLIADLKDTDMISKYVLELLTNKKKRKTLSLKAKNEARKFDWSIAAKKFYKEFDNLLP